ncbi:MAG: hypothetical protein WCS75_05460 [Sphingomonas sp.]|uniref:hypothetical protein n=1 Tax=Sphingomonas sp. TaxID=28214 RepID=UPI003565F77B
MMFFDEQRRFDDRSNSLEDTSPKKGRSALEQRFDDIAYMAVTLLDCSLAMIADAAPEKRVIALATQGHPDKRVSIEEMPHRMLDPIEAERLGLLFYCGFPLRDSTGRNIGHLGVYDVAHRKVAQIELDMMLRLSRITAALLEARS